MIFLTFRPHSMMATLILFLALAQQVAAQVAAYGKHCYHFVQGIS